LSSLASIFLFFRIKTYFFYFFPFSFQLAAAVIQSVKAPLIFFILFFSAFLPPDSTTPHPPKLSFKTSNDLIYPSLTLSPSLLIIKNTFTEMDLKNIIFLKILGTFDNINQSFIEPYFLYILLVSSETFLSFFLFQPFDTFLSDN